MNNIYTQTLHKTAGFDYTAIVKAKLARSYEPGTKIAWNELYLWSSQWLRLSKQDTRALAFSLAKTFPEEYGIENKFFVVRRYQ